MKPNYKTREAILGLRSSCTSGSLMESTCDLALQALDQERDAKLAADIRAYIADHPDTLTHRDKNDVRYLVDVIWDHLREESKS